MKKFVIIFFAVWLANNCIDSASNLVLVNSNYSKPISLFSVFGDPYHGFKNIPFLGALHCSNPRNGGHPFPVKIYISFWKKAIYLPQHTFGVVVDPDRDFPFFLVIGHNPAVGRFPALSCGYDFKIFGLF